MGKHAHHNSLPEVTEKKYILLEISAGCMDALMAEHEIARTLRI
jgi:hypothetical protein